MSIIRRWLTQKADRAFIRAVVYLRAGNEVNSAFWMAVTRAWEHLERIPEYRREMVGEIADAFPSLIPADPEMQRRAEEMMERIFTTPKQKA